MNEKKQCARYSIKTGVCKNHHLRDKDGNERNCNFNCWNIQNWNNRFKVGLKWLFQ